MRGDGGSWIWGGRRSSGSGLVGVEHTDVQSFLCRCANCGDSGMVCGGVRVFYSLFSGILYALSAQSLGARAVGRISFSHVFTPVFRADFSGNPHPAFCTLALDKHPDSGRTGIDQCRLDNCGNGRKQARVAARIDVGVYRAVHSGDDRGAGGHWRATRHANFANPAVPTVSNGIPKGVNALDSRLCGCCLGGRGIWYRFCRSTSSRSLIPARTRTVGQGSDSSGSAWSHYLWVSDWAFIARGWC